jgi:hypothetical protein
MYEGCPERVRRDCTDRLVRMLINVIGIAFRSYRSSKMNSPGSKDYYWEIILKTITMRLSIFTPL